jgi:hypothetical protein
VPSLGWVTFNLSGMRLHVEAIRWQVKAPVKGCNIWEEFLWRSTVEFYS